MPMKKKNKNITSHFAPKSPLSAEEQAELKALQQMSDADIDYSDIADSKDMQFYRPLKKSTTIRLDADILMWLKSKGKGYQTRINKILREKMLQEKVAP